MPPCFVRVLHRPPIVIHASKPTRRSNVPSRRHYTSSRRSERAVQPENKVILTALHRASAILPKILPPSKVTSWNRLIGTSGDILSSVTARKPRIAVLGLDELAEPTELVSALLDDPLSSDRQNTNALRGRRKEYPTDVLLIKYGELDISSTTLSLPLPWLKKLDVEILEIPTAHPESSTLLYDADLRIIITSPFSTTLPSSVEFLLLKPGSFLILNYPTLDQRVTDFTVSRLNARSSTISDALKAKLQQVYPSKALSALDLFRNESNSADAVQAFQDSFLRSGVSTLSQSISQALLAVEQETRKSCHAQLVLTGVLEACRNAVEDASRDVTMVQKHVQKLQSRAYEARAASVDDILGGKHTSEIGEAVERSTRDIRPTMDAMQWWKLPFKVDDLGETLSRAVERVWCHDLEAKLQFQTGRLSSLSSELTAATHATLQLLPPSFRSAVLVNTVDQLSTRPPDLRPNTLTYPIAYRLQQLQQPMLRLHRRAQRVVFTAIVTTFGSGVGAYTAWFMGWFAPSTSVGLGVLGTVIGVRWLVGSWEKGKKRWWEDWRRVGEGLERDLKNMLVLVLQEKVTAVPHKAAEELEKSVATRLAAIEEMNDELQSLESSSRHMYPQRTPGES